MTTPAALPRLVAQRDDRWSRPPPGIRLASWLALAEALTAQWRHVLGTGAAVHSWSGGPGRPWGTANATITAWLPGYPDPEYYLRLLLHSQSRTNEGGFCYAPFDQLIERARREGDGRVRLELFHQADRMAVTGQVALIRADKSVATGGGLADGFVIGCGAITP